MNRNFCTGWLGALVLSFFFSHGVPAYAGKPSAKFTCYRVPHASPHGIVYCAAGPLKGVWYTNLPTTQSPAR